MEHAEKDLGIAEQAHNWFGALSHAGPQERLAFANWLKASPRHVGEFLMVTAAHRHFGKIDPQRRIDVDALLAEGSNVVPLTQTLAQPAANESIHAAPEKDSHRMKWIAGITAAGMLTMFFGLHSWKASAEWKDYETLTGESQIVKFEDGSRAHLNTASKMQVRYLGDKREVRLLAGEALFEVKPNPKRPFRVYSGPAAIQALGTQFDVYRQTHKTKVSVLEGQVRISTRGTENQVAKLNAGEAADVAESGAIEPLPSPEAERLNSWPGGQYIFRDERLADVVAEFNRYNRVPQFRIAEASAGEQRLSGVFNIDAPESFVLVLERLRNLSVERKADEVIIREK